MTLDEAKRQILKNHWHPWLSRPFFAFVASAFAKGNSKRYFRKINLPGWEYRSFLFANNQWYEAIEVYERPSAVVSSWLKNHSIREITARLEKSYKIWKKQVREWAERPKDDTVKKLESIQEFLALTTTYVWASHLLEYVLMPKLRLKVSSLVKGNPDKFIGDAAFPSRLNAAELMLKAFRRGAKPAALAKEYGWLRARDGFARPYTAREVIGIIKHSLRQPKHRRPKLPRSLNQIFMEARELVYFRTKRSDVLFELLYLAKPLLREIGRVYKIPYSKLKYYTLQSLIAGHPRAYPETFSGASLDENIYLFPKNILKDKKISATRELKGTIAQTGKVSGVAKVVMRVADLRKVKQGDVLVTYMTSPNFLPAMKLAAGFVTNEGGLTCHAAIVAREMKKPCLIGTKFATQVLKDGDLVEVDADKGTVKILKKAK